MSEEYGKPAMVPVGFDFDSARLEKGENTIVLSGMEVLGIVQAAFNDIGPATERIIAVKRAVLEQVSEGRLAEALRTAIVGAAKSGCASGN